MSPGSPASASQSPPWSASACRRRRSERANSVRTSPAPCRPCHSGPAQQRQRASAPTPGTAGTATSKTRRKSKSPPFASSPPRVVRAAAARRNECPAIEAGEGVGGTVGCLPSRGPAFLEWLPPEEQSLTHKGGAPRRDGAGRSDSRCDNGSDPRGRPICALFPLSSTNRLIPRGSDVLRIKTKERRRDSVA